MSDLQLTKRCLGPCNQELPATEEFFNKHPSGKYGLQPRCKNCKRDENKKFVQDNPGRKKAWDKKYAENHPEQIKAIHAKHRKTDKWKNGIVKRWLENKYGLTEEQYQEIWDKQNGLCAICGKSEETTQRLHVDHDHESNVVRGLLCGKCNRGIGMFEDKEELLQKAAEYLHQASTDEQLIPVRTPNPRSKNVSIESIKQLRSLGLPLQKIGETVGLSVASVHRKLKGWPESEFHQEAA